MGRGVEALRLAYLSAVLLHFTARSPSIMAGTSGKAAAPLSDVLLVYHNYKSNTIYPAPFYKILLLLEVKRKQIDSITTLCVRACVRAPHLNF